MVDGRNNPRFDLRTVSAVPPRDGIDTAGRGSDLPACFLSLIPVLERPDNPRERTRILFLEV